MSKRQKKRLIRIIISAVVFATSFLFFKIDVIQVVFQMLAYLIVGYDVLLSAGRKILSGQIFDEEFLMSLATVGAVMMEEFPEAAMVMLLYQLGELFQAVAVGKSRRSIKELMKLKPDFATVIRDGQEIKLPPEKVEKDEIILVLPGEKVALDGIIEKGNTSFDASSLTGESVSVPSFEGDRAISGMINLKSPVRIRVSGTYEESTVAKILKLVETSSAHKSHSEKFITKFSRKYTPCVLGLALLTAFLPPLLFSQPLAVWVRRALVFLVVSCPCALVISVPLTFFSAIGAASKRGILIKGSSHLETLSKVQKMAFDKTGTLTHGGFSVEKVCPENITEEKLLEIAALAESQSKHPIALSIIDGYKKELDTDRVENTVNLSGSGIKAQIDGESVLVGNCLLMKNNSIEITETSEDGTLVHVAKNGEYMGYILLSDNVKPEAKDAVALLKKSGINRNLLLTGDNEYTAESVAKVVGIDEVYSRLLPQDKVELVLSLREDGAGKVAFAGDGINDAPVLSCADIGIAMGALGSDAAIEAADVVIMNDNLLMIAEAVKLSKKTMRIVCQNITLSLIVKFGVMILSMAGFDNMYAAIFSDVGVMIIAVLNAMRMLKIK